MEIATIGFTQSSAERFFERLRAAGVERVLDVRLHNVSQLAGFAKSADLAYFLKVICLADYEHNPTLAPSPELFDAFKRRKGAWDVYERGYLDLMRQRNIPDGLDRALFQRKTVLLCSEAKPDQCHRRLLAELLTARWGATVEHL